MLEQQLIQSPRNATLPAKICNPFPSTNFEVIKVEPRRRLTSSDLCQFDPCYVKDMKGVRITRGVEANKKENSIGEKKNKRAVELDGKGLDCTGLLCPFFPSLFFRLFMCTIPGLSPGLSFVDCCHRQRGANLGYRLEFYFMCQEKISRLENFTI